jgi:periplasmic protein TonB
MRIEICVALLASTALHAGLLVLVPASVASRDSAGPVSAAPRVLTANLKNTFAPDKAARAGRLNSARAARSPAAQPLMSKRPARSAEVLGREPRVDNPLRFYPPEAVARGLEGEAILMLRFGADGALIDAQIAKSSGHAILDEAALRAIRATPRFASAPREILFPVTFALH